MLQIILWKLEIEILSLIELFTENGGSLYLLCPSYDYCEYDVYNNSFTNNTANVDGGAII